MMKFKSLACAALILGFCVDTFAAVENVSVGIYDLPPHMIIAKDNTPHGAVPEFFQKYVFKDPSLSVRWNPAQFSRIMVDLENGRLDMAVLVAKNSDRERKFIFSNTPLYKTRSGIVVKKNGKLQKIESIHSLNGLQLGHDLGSIVPTYFKNSGVQFQFVSGEDYFSRTLSLLRSGRIDGFFVPTWSHGAYQLKKSKLSSEFSILEIPSGALDLYVVFGKKTDAKVIQTVNVALKNHHQKYLKILSQVEE
ncbi:substrate-binding periplasmic protein [Bdellovibrio sp. HCB-110]|uniref:substrate-binding periplasmic protein n=1 Tax=Bdellovibrio sp. HCB-110 TaxID=3391182 RepID=UPI0039B3BEA6